MHTYIRTYIHNYIRKYIHTVHQSLYTYINTHIRTHKYVHTHTYTYVHTYVVHAMVVIKIHMQIHITKQQCRRTYIYRTSIIAETASCKSRTDLPLSCPLSSIERSLPLAHSGAKIYQCGGTQQDTSFSQSSTNARQPPTAHTTQHSIHIQYI